MESSHQAGGWSPMKIFETMCRYRLCRSKMDEFLGEYFIIFSVC
jgi:hypothetical protein